MSAVQSSVLAAQGADRYQKGSTNVHDLERDVVRSVTEAPLRMTGQFVFHAPQEVVFERVSEPTEMSKWFPLLKGGDLDHGSSCAIGDWGEGSKRTCYTNGMGTLFETIHHYDAPNAYAYEVQNFMMPIRNHLALMVIEPLTDRTSRLTWNQYFDLKGIAMRHMFPTMMITMMNTGMKTLAKDLGGPGGKMMGA